MGTTKKKSGKEPTKVMALTVKFPFAHGLVLGDKKIEYRAWRPPENIIGGVLVIHSGKTPNSEWLKKAVKKNPDIMADFRHVLGVAIGAVTLTKVVYDKKNEVYGWHVKPLTVFGTLIPLRGQRGLFDVSKHKTIKSELKDYV